MNLLSAENIAKSFTERVLFENLTFGISQGEKIALVGANGVGKSTFLKILAGIMPTDAGLVSVRKGIKVSYLPQQPELPDNATAIDIILSDDTPRAQATASYLKYMEHPERYEAEMENIFQAMDDTAAWDFEQRAAEILGQLSIHDLEQTVGSMSGGQRKRVAMAKMLLSEPDLLLLDEPTNHLDLDAIRWLEQFLGTAGTSLILITHDRYFLDAVCNEIMELSAAGIARYKAKYPEYLEQKAERTAITQAGIDKAKNLLVKELEWMRRQPKARGTKARYRIDAFYELKDKASQKIEENRLEINMKTARLGSKILEIEKLSKSLGGKQLIKDFTHIFQRGERVGVIGKNGMGKSTFLNLITGKLSPDSGSIVTGQTIKYGYYTQESINLNLNNRVIDEVKAIAEYITLGNGEQVTAGKLLEMFLFSPKSQYSIIGKLSGGERRRIQLLKVLIASPNFLILDEPTNDLDIDTLNVLEQFLEQFPGCLMLVSHDRYFMDKLVDHLFVFEGEGKIRNFNGNYSDYRDFLDEGGDKVIEQEKPKEKALVNGNQELKATETAVVKRKKSFKEQQEFADLEKRLPSLETEKATLTEALSTTTHHQQIVEISAKLQALEQQIELGTLRWLELSELD